MKKKIFSLLATISLLLLVSCNSDDSSNSQMESNSSTTKSVKSTSKKRLQKELIGDYVVLTDLDFAESNIETFESKDDISTRRIGTGEMIRKFDDEYRLHKVSISKNIYFSLIAEGLDDEQITILMTPGEYLDAIGACVLAARTPIQLKVCVGITTAQMLVECWEATPETESIHC